jgi:4-hydroxythreonine-4-phosphate dehydrogenase
MSTQTKTPSVISAKPRIVVLLGDPSGVGPEMAVKLLARQRNLDAARVLLIADPIVLAEGERVAGVKLDPLQVDGLNDLRFEDGRPQPVPARLDGGRGAGARRIERALGPGLVRGARIRDRGGAARAGRRDRLRAAQQAFAAPGRPHARGRAALHAGALRGAGFVCEFNLTGSLWTSRVTSHIPLKDVASHITVEGVGDAVKIIAQALRRAGVAQPRIAVTGLNPHAGDGGSIGMEEIEIIAPAIAQLRAEGYDARGPFSPDTVFIGARRGDVDAVVSMYHDQGQIAMKLMGFEQGVTLHGGLPVPVATSASGSAFDIAGKGIAQIEGLQQAFDLCVRMASGGAPAAGARGDRGGLTFFRKLKRLSSPPSRRRAP